MAEPDDAGRVQADPVVLDGQVQAAAVRRSISSTNARLACE